MEKPNLSLAIGPMLALLLLIGLMLFGPGCAAKRTGIRLIIPVACIDKPIVAYDCKNIDMPEHTCRRTEPISYKAGCAIVQRAK
jgi:hypothetical protein